MSWTTKQRLSLAGAAGIQVVLAWMFFHQTIYLPAVPEDGSATRILFAHLIEQAESPATIASSVPSMLPIAEPRSDTLQNISDALFYRRLDQDLLSRAGYLPASLLTEKPKVVMDIDPELSQRFAFIPPQTLALTLLINEYGDVDHVLLADSPPAVSAEPFPAVLLEELKQHFFEARFLPGRLRGRAVRSALNIRVSLGP